MKSASSETQKREQPGPLVKGPQLELDFGPEEEALHSLLIEQELYGLVGA